MTNLEINPNICIA